MKISIPYPPALNRLYRVNKFGSLYLSREGKQYKDAVKEMLKDLSPFGDTANLSLRIKMFPPDRRKRDIDGILKISLDALESSGLIPNDSQIHHLEVIKRGAEKENPRLEVELIEVAEGL